MWVGWPFISPRRAPRARPARRGSRPGTCWRPDAKRQDGCQTTCSLSRNNLSRLSHHVGWDPGNDMFLRRGAPSLSQPSCRLRIRCQQPACRRRRLPGRRSGQRPGRGDGGGRVRAVLGIRLLCLGQAGGPNQLRPGDNGPDSVRTAIILRSKLRS